MDLYEQWTMSSAIGYIPSDTNLLARLYSVVKNEHPMVLQTHLWNYKPSYIRETRAEEIIKLACEVIDNG